MEGYSSRWWTIYKRSIKRNDSVGWTGMSSCRSIKKWERSSKCCRKIQTGYRNTGYTNAAYDRDGGCAVDTWELSGYSSCAAYGIWRF